MAIIDAGTETVAQNFLGDNGAFQTDWFNSLPEDTFEKDDTGAPKRGDLADHKNLSALVKSYLNAQKLVGTAIQPLAEDATPEQKRAYFTKLGCPEKIEGYEVAKPQLPEGMAYDDDLIKTTTQFAHDNGIPKGVFEGLAKIVIEGQSNKFKELVAAAAQINEKTFETASNKLKGKWGAKYDENVETANRFYNLPGDDNVNKAFVDLLESKGLHNHPATVEFFHEAYKLVKEDTIPPGGTATGGKPPEGQLSYPKSPGMTRSQ